MISLGSTGFVLMGQVWDRGAMYADIWMSVTELLGKVLPLRESRALENGKY